ncbi:hypothetical protein NW755_013917 [Fusarium falciforme]|uniref:Alpha/beta hydrolase fold-3 domain-containing protein n=1 Tax=Fusarium falciforme TaxID=195108 RepID=A0A9W8UV33_9HYPO|nr:hypothetical protein NW755_013917 [Fusarium falciforme]
MESQIHVPENYRFETFEFKQGGKGGISLDVWYPTRITHGPLRTIVYYHGGFLVFGDRQRYPLWLLDSWAARGGVFVSVDYRLLPESTGVDAVADSVDAYNWVATTLGVRIGAQIGPIAVVGSSAGGYLALTTAGLVTGKKLSAVALIYGVLDPSAARYHTKGSNIFFQPCVDAGPVLEYIKSLQAKGTEGQISGHPFPTNPAADPRSAIVAVFHGEALFPDYLTGVAGLGERIHEQGIEAIPKEHRKLFPVAFGQAATLPPIFILHGKNDAAVPVDQGVDTANKLRGLGVAVTADFPDDAQHGFDSALGNIDIETSELQTPAAQSLRSLINFLDQHTS